MNADGDLFSEERLRVLVEEHGAWASDGLRERIVRDVEAHVAAADPHDDMTLIVVDDRRRAVDGGGEGDARMIEPEVVFRTRFRRRGLDRARPAAGARLRGDGLAPTASGRSFRRRPPAATTSPWPCRRRSPTRRDGWSRAGATCRRRAATSRARARGFAALEARIGHRFVDRTLLEHALTHRSRAHEDVTGGVVDNESLEFLGDAVVGLVIAEALYREYPDLDEGAKSKIAPRWSRPAGSPGSARRSASAITCSSVAARRRPADGARPRCSPTRARRSSRRSTSTPAWGAAAEFVRRERRLPFEASGGRRGGRRSASTTNRRCRSACRPRPGICRSIASRRKAVPSTTRCSRSKCGSTVRAATATGKSKKVRGAAGRPACLQAFA